jgi:putative transposase
MKDFESECEKLNIGLFVLPPKRPDYNGGVERTNRIFREEFYNKPTLIADSVRGIQAELTKAIHKYNNFRPHHNLKGLTPMQYIKSNLLKVAA